MLGGINHNVRFNFFFIIIINWMHFSVALSFWRSHKSLRQATFQSKTAHEFLTFMDKKIPVKRK